MKQVEEFNDGRQIRRILQGMITNKVILGRISSKWDGKLFASPEANRIASWCIEHYKNFNESPKKGILGLFETWSEQSRDPSETKRVDSLLSLMSDEFELSEEINVNQTLETAWRMFRKTRLTRLRDSIENTLASGQVEKADDLVTSYAKLEGSIGVGTNLHMDKEAIKSALTRERFEPLIEFDTKPLNQFFGTRLRRGGFIAILAPEKVGKTTWLVDLTHRAIQQRRRVAFFEIGDDSEDELHERFLVRLTGIPFENDSQEWPYVTKSPKAIKTHKLPAGRKESKVKFEKLEFEQPLDWKLALKECEQLQSNHLKSKKPYLKTQRYSSLSIGVAGIRSVLDQWQLENWVPDIVVVDYADNLAPPPGKMDVLDQTNQNWQLLRAISQDRGCLLLSATQVNRAGYEKELIDRRHVSGDKRKLAHATGLVGLNVWGTEKERGITRLNWVVARKGKYSSSKVVYVAGCWDVGNPAVVSCW